jgi:GDPmannose 4,6-dehydratase
MDMGCLLSILQTAEFDEIYHLASQSHVGLSFSMPVLTGDVTALGTTRLLYAIVQLNMCQKFRVYNVYVASTSIDTILTKLGMHVGTLWPDRSR